MDTRECNVCNQTKPLDNFQVIDASGSRRRICRECLRQKYRDYYYANRTERLAYARWYTKTPAGREVQRSFGKRDRASGKSRTARRSRWHSSPEERAKVQARQMVGLALKSGILTRPKRCERCKRKCKPDGHHYLGYEGKHWLDVEWLCHDCHSLADLERRVDSGSEDLERLIERQGVRPIYSPSGPPETERQCVCCDATKPIGSFGTFFNHRTHRQNRRMICKECWLAKRKAYREANSEKLRKQRAKHYRTKNVRLS